MAHRPLRGRYHIITWENGNYLGASISVPPNSPLYSVPVVVLPRAVMTSPVMLTPFTVEPVDGGDSTYIIMAEKRNTRCDEDGVFAFQNEPAEEWVIRCEGSQGQYIIFVLVLTPSFGKSAWRAWKFLRRIVDPLIARSGLTEKSTRLLDADTVARMWDLTNSSAAALSTLLPPIYVHPNGILPSESGWTLGLRAVAVSTGKSNLASRNIPVLATGSRESDFPRWTHSWQSEFSKLYRT
ncbi:hypothetical protein EV401DRAFT_1886182 [Pisolithus croceorrhizus]|nr:hypothetical protein EV401DRAFT_1886182 [Pisolithus croceorrhizus]